MEWNTLKNYGYILNDHYKHATSNIIQSLGLKNK